MSQKRKTIIFIVEGASEQVALELSLSEFFQNHDIRFHIVHGDITTEKNTSSANIITRINAVIEKEMKLYGLKRKDIAAIIHLVDTDGVFISDNNVIESCTNSVIYESECIKTREAAKIINRNNSKSSVLRRLIRCYEVNKIPYRIFYMSCNLDHVIADNQNATDDEKESYSTEFSFRYSDNLSGFLEFFQSVMPEAFTYKESWEFIQTDNNSLKRYSNLSILFEKDMISSESLFGDKQQGNT